MLSLLIDAGNTRIKWCVMDGAGTFVQRGNLLTVNVQSLASVEELPDPLDRAIFVSVAGDTVDAVLESQLARMVTGGVERFRSAGWVAGLRNDYARPEQLGADRLAAALGAWWRVGGDCLVANFGTATTIDVVRAGAGLQEKVGNATFSVQARFSGGVILPGLSLMRTALHRGTARLPEAAGTLVGIPDNTDDAIETGCHYAQLGALEEMRRQMPAETALVIAGGAADRLLPLLVERGLKPVDAPDLVLEGLAAAILHRF